jgi:hypothetical protein
MVALSCAFAAELAVENCRRNRLLITSSTANREGDSYESAIFMIEARPPAGAPPTRH